MTETATPLLAVLVDADNISPRHTQAIFDEIAKFGEASVRRVYGDFSSSQMVRWNKVQAEHGLVPYHQPANTVGKNASDIALVIDAMDLLHTGRFDGFVLVSSDSDFTRLASRIREQGLDVFGIGEKKTPEAFRKACKRFIFVENLTGDASPPVENDTTPGDAMPDPSLLIRQAMEAMDQDDEWYLLGAIGSKITAAHPDFDTRSYGYKKLIDLAKSLSGFETKRKDGNLVLVRQKP